MTITTLFLASCVGMILMIGWKIFERKVRKIDFVSHTFTRGDDMIRGWERGMKERYELGKKIIHVFIFDFLPLYAYRHFNRMKDYIARIYSIMEDQIRGK